MTIVKRNHKIQASPSRRSNQSLAVCIRLRCPNWVNLSGSVIHINIEKTPSRIYIQCRQLATAKHFRFNLLRNFCGLQPISGSTIQEPRFTSVHIVEWSAQLIAINLIN